MPELGDQDEFGESEYPHYEDLPEESKAILRAIKTPADIKSSYVMATWWDDHQICVGVVLNNVEFGAWWCGWQVAGAFLYWESQKAKEAIVEYIQQTTSDLDEAMRANAETEAADSGLAPYPGETQEEFLQRRANAADPDEITPEDLPQ